MTANKSKIESIQAKYILVSVAMFLFATFLTNLFYSLGVDNLISAWGSFCALIGISFCCVTFLSVLKLYEKEISEVMKK